MKPVKQNLTRKAIIPQRPQLQESRSNCNNNANKSSSNTIAGLYDLGDTIGKGHYATVKVAHHVFTGEKVAVKVIDKTKLDDISKAHLFQEVRCMKLVQHTNVVKLYQVIDTQSKLYLILEYADGGDLFDYIMKHSEGLNENLARDYFQQILHAIDFCHKLHVVHRDLKPENVVFFKNQKTVKLTDFGFSNKFVPGNKLDTSCGSLAYSAPEILLGVSYDAPAVDIWSLGVVLYMLVCGQPPFQEANDSETLTMIMDCKYTVPDYVSPPCKHLISQMLVKEPTQRATLEDIKRHEWLLPLKESSANISPELPLVCKQALTMDDHNEVVDKMVAGGFANLAEITESLNNQAYDHITATYYLLAERLLRKKLANPIASVSPHLSPENPILFPLALSPRCTSPINSSASVNNTIIEDATSFEHTPIECLISPPGRMTPSPSNTILTNEPSDIQKIRQQLTQLQPPSPRKTTTNSTPTLCPYSLVGLPPVIPGRPICNVHSSPQLLNEICEEEDESENEEPVRLEASTRRRDKRHRLQVGHAGACSSEDVSDSEESRKNRVYCGEKKDEKKDGKESNRKGESRRVYARCGVDVSRRDSSEHSSDTDGGSCFVGRMKQSTYCYSQQPSLNTNKNNRSGNSHNGSYGSRRHTTYRHASCPDNTEEYRGCCHVGKRGHTNPLRAALLKLNVPLRKEETDDDLECSHKHFFEIKGSKLFSVLEENSPPPLPFHHSSSPPKTIGLASHLPPTRKSSSLINICSYVCNEAQEEEEDDGSMGSYCHHCYLGGHYGTPMHSSFSSSSSSSLSCLHSLFRSLDLNQPHKLYQSNLINLCAIPSLQMQPSCG